MPRSTKISERPIRGGHLEPVYVVNQVDDPLNVSLPNDAVITVSGSITPFDYQVDAFGRGRVSQPLTIFDSKQIHDKQPLFWDDQQTSGSGTSSTHNPNRASTTLQVSNLTAGERVRQTKQAFNYQPGKAQLAIETFVLGAGASGIRRRVGLFDDKNGLFLQLDGATLSFVVRTYVTGATVDTVIPQSSWNIDKLDGTGDSGITLDVTKAQIFFCDFEWLGVGIARFGFYIRGKPIFAHMVYNANQVASVYMSTPNLPVRYEITNDGTGPQATLETICTTVISEGGAQDNGKLTHISTNATALGAGTSGTLYALIGIKLKAAYWGLSINWESIDILEPSTGNLQWLVLLNPTVAGTFTYSDVTNSGLQRALGATANTVTGGTSTTLGGFLSGKSAITNRPHNAIKLGRNIAGTMDEMVLCVRPLANNLNVYGGITLREL